MGHIEHPLSLYLEVARRNTRFAAALSDRQTRSKRNRALRDIARKLKKGYIIATEKELRERYGSLIGFPQFSTKAKIIWGIIYTQTRTFSGSIRYELDFFPAYIGAEPRS